MKTFTDAASRTWTVNVNVATVKRVKELLEIDLTKLIDDKAKPLAELISDPIKLVDVVYVLCKTQADAEKVSDEDFGRAMWGDSIYAAADAFLGAWIDFHPANKREALANIITKSRQLDDRMAQAALENINRIDVGKVFDREAAKMAEALAELNGPPVSEPAK